MKKAILALVVVIAVVALALPPVIGGTTRSNLEAHIAQMDENPVLALRVAEYDRGWFSSTAAVEIGLDESYIELMAGGDAAVQDELSEMLGGTAITVNLDIAHGPIAFADGIYFGMSRIHALLDDSDDNVATITDELGMPYLAELTGWVSYGGTFTFTANVPPIEYLHEDGQVSFTGLTLDGSLSGPELTVDASAQRLFVDAAGSTATLEGFTAHGDSTRINHILWAGDFATRIEQVTIVESMTGTGSVNIAGLRLEGDVDIDETGELLDAVVTYAADSVAAPQEGLAVSDAQFTMRFTDMSVEAVTEYYDIMLNMDMENPAAAALALPPVLSRLLERNPSVAFDPIRFTLNDESFTAAMSLRTVNGDSGAFDISNPMMLLGMFEASASLTATKALLENLATQAAMAQLAGLDESQLPQDQDVESMAEAQTQLMIATFLGQGYLIDDGENYTTEIEYASGEIRVNGMPLPLGALLQ